MLRILLILHGICEIRLYYEYKGIGARLREKEVVRKAERQLIVK